MNGRDEIRNSDNAPRFRDHRGGHVESWFFRANHPEEPKAVWWKATVLRRGGGGAVAEGWCVLFDGTRTFAAKRTVPLHEASFSDVPLRIAAAGSVFRLGSSGEAVGGVVDRAGVEAAWDVGWESDSGLGDPLCLLPSRLLLGAPLPRSKLLTPMPVLAFRGSVRWGETTWDIGGWRGMQGHNWGREHAAAYAWGACEFPSQNGAPPCYAEGFSGKIALGPTLTPWISALVVRRGDREYRFDRLLDLRRQRPVVSPGTEQREWSWKLEMSGPTGRAALSMRADPASVVDLAYENPDGSVATCSNSKIARVELSVIPKRDPPFELRSRHGGALEFLSR